jgi:ribosomal protein S18 acetylase RimI-like enzyme
VNDPQRTSAVQVAPLEGEPLERECAALMAASDPWLTLGYGFEELLGTMRLPGRERYVAHVDGEFAGFVLLNLHGTFAGYIQTIGLAPQFRGSGHGAELLAFAEQRIFREHQNVFLCVSSFNHAARRFYERLGYSQVGELVDFLVQGHSELLLRKTIGPLRQRKPY